MQLRQGRVHRSKDSGTLRGELLAEGNAPNNPSAWGQLDQQDQQCRRRVLVQMQFTQSGQLPDPRPWSTLAQLDQPTECSQFQDWHK
jgi:hypothetical protein